MAIQMSKEFTYSPARDVYHILPDITKAVSERMIVSRPFKPLTVWLGNLGITDQELADGTQAFVQFLTLAQNEPELNIVQAAEKSGWPRVRWEIQVAVAYYIGTGMLGIFFEGAHLTVLPGQQTPTLAGMLLAAQDLSDYVKLPWWRRWWYRRQYQGHPSRARF